MVAKTTLRKTVERWLDEGGHEYSDLAEDEERFAWQFSVNWPVHTNWHIDLIEPSDEQGCLQIFATVNVVGPHREGLRALSEDERDNFRDDLTDALLNEFTLYSILTGDPEEQPEGEEGRKIIKRFLVEARAYEDGLSKTVFYDKLIQVHSTRTKAVRVFHDWFGSPEDGPATEAD